MIIASCFKRFAIIATLVLLVHTTSFSMIMDNRYFPWLTQLYNGADQRKTSFSVDNFFITGGDAYRHEARSSAEEQTVGFPELWGQLHLADVGQSLEAVGKTNPIPADWKWLSDFKVNMCGSLEGQGLALSGYHPVTRHIGVGGSVLFMRLNSLVHLEPDTDTVTKLQLQTPGNQALFTQTLYDVYKEVEINSLAFKEIGVGDAVVYFTVYDVKEYCYKLRKIDWSVWAGLIIPSGLEQDPHNVASLPFGGNGLWGWFVAPYAEFELRDDLKFGIMARLTKRFDGSISGRVPIGKETPLFAPIVGSVGVSPGTSFTVSPYVVVEDLSGGFGVEGRYTVTYHEQDSFRACLTDRSIQPNFNCMKFFSGWVQEYATVRLFYDASHNQNWDLQPLIHFTWDIPRSHIGGKGCAKTHRISLGCSFNF